MMRRPAIPMIAILLCAGLAPSRSAVAHVGPPFPILVDQPLPGHVVTVWTDPDVGEAVFYVVLEPAEPASAGSISEVDVWVQPVSGRLPKTVYRAERARARGHLRFVAKPEFDVAEPWTVGVDIRLGDGTSHPFVTQVEATPPGLGSWDLLIYLFPFVLFGGLWGIAFIRRSRATASKAGSSRSLSEAAAADPGARTTAPRKVLKRPGDEPHAEGKESRLQAALDRLKP